MKLIAIIPLLLTSCPAVDRENIVGCYAVFEHVVTHNVTNRVVEKSIRLTSRPSSSPWSEGGFEVVPAIATEDIAYHSLFWREENKRLLVTFSNTGLSGLRMTLRDSFDGFEGTIERYWDFQEPTDVHAISLTRKSCESFAK